MKWDKKIIHSITFSKFQDWDMIICQDDIKPDEAGGTMLIEADLCRGVLDFAGYATLYSNGRIATPKVVENDWIQCFGWFTWSVEPMFYDYWKEMLPTKYEVTISDARKVWNNFVKEVRALQSQL